MITDYKLYTWTADSNIFWVAAVVYSNFIARTVDQSSLISSTAQFIQENQTCALPKRTDIRGNSTYTMKKIHLK